MLSCCWSASFHFSLKNSFQHFLQGRSAAAAAKLLQSCPTLCDPIDGSPPDSSVPGILQARTLEWVAISFSNAWKWKVKVKLLSRLRFFATPWTAAYQAPPSVGFSRQEYWSGVPLPSPIPSLIMRKMSEKPQIERDSTRFLGVFFFKVLQSRKPETETFSQVRRLRRHNCW